MRESRLWLLFVAGAAVTLAAHAATARVVVGPALWERVPDVAGMEVRTTGGGVVHTGTSVLLETAACAEPCRAAVAFAAGSPGVPWRVTAHLSRAGTLERARLFAVIRDADGATQGYAGASAQPGEGTVTLDVPSDWVGQPVEVGVVAVGTGGVVTVDHVAIMPARLAAPRVVLTAVAVLLWTVLGLGTAFELATRLPPRIRAIAGVVGAAVVGGVLLPRPTLEWLLSWVPGAATADLSATLWEDPSLPLVVQKIGGHGGAFALLAACGRASGASPSVVLVRLAGFSAATELVQLFRPGRSATFTDVGFDLAGALVGLMLFRAAPRAP